MLYPQNKVNKFIRKENNIWGTQKNIGEDENWVQKKEELEKEVKKSKLKSERNRSN